MQKFYKGQIVRLAVQGIVTENDKPYIYLSDGFVHTYRVQAFDFQTEWEEILLPDFIQCYVSDVDYRGLPFLVQNRKDVLESCYTHPGFYPFKLLSVHTDENTQARFYSLRDSFGIKHRYYPPPGAPEKEVNDIFSLWVAGTEDVENNKAYLRLEYKMEQAETAIATKKEQEESNDDPRNKSFLGYENEYIEFKSSIVYPAGNIAPDIDKQMQIIAKTIAGFQNAHGGKLYIGVNDSGNIIGIERDFPHLNSSTTDNYKYKENIDGYESKIRNGIKSLLGNISNSKVKITFSKSEDNLNYCLLEIDKSDRPVFMQGMKLFQRAGNMTQLLKDDEISYLIEERWHIRNRLQDIIHRNIEVADNSFEIAPVGPSNNDKSSSKEEFEESLEVEKINYDDVWVHVTFYKNGDWSYQKSSVSSLDVELNLAIPKSLKKGLIVIAYDNGRVNIVSVENLIRPKRKNGGRKMRPENKRYQTGWHYEAGLLHVFVSKPNDLLVFYSSTSDGNSWVKIHNITDISDHDINAMGNILINERFDDAEITQCLRLPYEYYPYISALVLKSHQTSGSLGYTVNNLDMKKSIKLLERVLGKISRND